MEIEPGLIRAALRQQLETDRLLGVTFVPIPPPRRRVASWRTPGPLRGHGRYRLQDMPTQGRGHGTRAAAVAGKSEKADQLRILDEAEVKGCTKCRLCETRTQTVFGQGSSDARLVFVGEGPGYEEDRQGLAFVGRAGQLLTRMIAAMGLTREEVFICNVLKCRPPGNRDPSADEILACSPYLRRQIEIIEPEIVVALGAPAAKTLLNTAAPIGKLRGRFHDYFLSGVAGKGPAIPLMPTYHPAYLLRNPAEKGKVWDDLQRVMQRLGLPLPDRKSS